jgi:transcriptional regulator with PAS, ATPase and Fis domain
VQDGSFREDLFYRLNGAPLFLPPLRERREDVIPLAEYFLRGLAAKQNATAPALARDARAFLLGHAWPGNVRELQNMMAWAITFQEENGTVNADALERWVRSNSSLLASPAAESDPGTGSLRQLVDRFEERTVREALSRNDNNVSATAKALGLSRQMLHEKIKKYKIVTRES